MAQDIDLLGAVYQDVPGVELPADGGGTSIFYDVSDTTADPSDVADGEVYYSSVGVRSLGTGKYAAAPVANGNAKVTNAILYGTVDGTSTSTVFTATVSGLTELVDGTCVMLHNGVVTSASGFTINLNNLGAKKCYNNMTNATQDTTIFNVNYTMLFVYSSALDSGAGGWWLYRGYNSDNNTIGYQIRTNSTAMPTISRTRYYRLLFTSADRTKWVPANTTYDNSATSIKTPNSNAIDPFGRIVYMTGTTNVPAGSNVGATVTWDQYVLALGYSFNTTGQALTLTYPAPVFVKCAPQTNGSAIIDSTTPYVQALPSTADGKIYIYLGMAYSATNIELVLEHPVYEYKDGALRLWTNAASGGSSVSPYTSNPAMDGTASAGVSDDYARGDHVHPTDTSRAASTHAHGNITSGGDITATATIASGDRLVINDESASKVTNSGITFGTSTTTFLANNGTWQTPAGSISYYTTTATLPTTGWVGDSITVSVTDMTASADVIVAPAPASSADWAAAGITCTGQGTGTLTFSRTSANANALTANLMVFSGGQHVVSSATVNITLTNPVNAGSFQTSVIYEQDTSEMFDESEVQIGTIDSATWSGSVNVSKAYLKLQMNGTSVAGGTSVCTGGVSFVNSPDGAAQIYAVASSGTIVLDGLDYNDD